VAQEQYRANLSAANFPFLSQLHGQTVIVGGKDQNFMREIDSQADVDKDRGIPQAYYMENVVATGQGFQSVGFNVKISGLAGATDFRRAYVLRDPLENFAYFDPANGKNYVYDGNVGMWLSTNPIAGVAGKLCTVTFISGQSYIFYEGIGMFRYDFATKAIVAVPLTGIVAASLIGIVAAQGFLIAWDHYTIYRSSLADPTNFTPDFTVGAGSTQVQDLRGAISFCLQIPQGFMIYTEKNCVSATFSVNQQEPFVFNAVKGGGGIKELHHCSYRDNAGGHYAWTNSGMQMLNKATAIPAFPELTDFLISKVYESFDLATWSFVIEKLAAQVKVAVNVVASRFLVVSYGKTVPYTFALVYDLTFKRWGKLKITHVDVFEFVSPRITGIVPYNKVYNNSYESMYEISYLSLLTGLAPTNEAKDVLGFMQEDGTILSTDFSLTSTGDSGILVLGKYQHRRQSFLDFEEIFVENVDSDLPQLALKILSTLNGKDVYHKDWNVFLDPKTPTGSMLQHYFTTATGKNHSLVFSGTFHICSLVLVYHMGGRA